MREHDRRQRRRGSERLQRCPQAGDVTGPVDARTRERQPVAAPPDSKPEQDANALQDLSQLAPPAGAIDEPVAVAHAVESDDGADRDERRPRDREVEAGLALTFDQQIDRGRTGCGSERGMLERIERQHAHLPLPLRVARPPEHDTVQGCATLRKESTEPNSNQRSRVAEAEHGPVLDLRHSTVREDVARERCQLRRESDREEERPLHAEGIEHRVPTGDRRHGSQGEEKHERGHANRRQQRERTICSRPRRHLHCGYPNPTGREHMVSRTRPGGWRTMRENYSREPERRKAPPCGAFRGSGGRI
jgi:hypothetical protein